MKTVGQVKETLGSVRRRIYHYLRKPAPPPPEAPTSGRSCSERLQLKAEASVLPLCAGGEREQDTLSLVLRASGKN